MTLTESSRSVFKTRGPLDPVNDSAIYVPRPELDRLLQAAQATTIDAYLAILSSRQTGKTSLLYQVRHRLRARGYGVALLDLAVVRDQPEDQLYRFVSSEMRSELEPNLPRATEKRDVSTLPTNPLEFRRFMYDIARQVRAPRIVVLIDEVESVPEKYSDAFFGTLRNVFSSRRKEDESAFEKYLFVLCGAKELHRLSTGPNSPLNIAERIYLQDLTLAGVNLLVGNFQRAGITAPPETAQWLFDQTHGHPYLTQKLCSTIEQWHPATIDPEIVQRAAKEILRSDDHLEKMIMQIDAEPAVRDTLKQVASEENVPFSRLNPNVARLELIGAIRDDGRCIVRNAIYRQAFKAHFNLPDQPSKPASKPRPWGRIFLAALALLIFVVNVPFLFTYARDILFGPRSVNEVFAPVGFGARAIIRYDQVLRANDSTPASIIIDTDDFVDNTKPLAVTFRSDDADIVRDGTARRELKPPSAHEKYSFSLVDKSIPYNPLQTTTDHRRVALIFESTEKDKPSFTYTADFRVDYFTNAIVSFAATIASIFAFLGALWANVQKARDFAGFLLKLVQPAPK